MNRRLGKDDPSSIVTAAHPDPVFSVRRRLIQAMLITPLVALYGKSAFAQSGLPALIGSDEAPGNAGSRMPGAMSIREFGVVGDGTRDDGVRILRAIRSCKANGRTLFWPAGTYLVRTAAFVDKRGTIDLAAGESVIWRGEGSGTILKRADGDVAAAPNPRWASIFVFNAPNGVTANSVDIEGFHVDGNFAGNPETGGPSSNEQAAFFKIQGAGTGYVRSARFNKVHFTDPVADNISLGPDTGTQNIGSVHCSDLTFENRNSVRDDIFIGSSCTEVFISDCQGIDNGINATRIETEFVTSGPGSTRIYLDNVHVGRLELAGLSGKSRQQLVRAKNCTFSTYVIVTWCDAQFDNCTLRLPELDKGGMWIDPIVRINRGTILIPYAGGKIYPWTIFHYPKRYGHLGTDDLTIDVDGADIRINATGRITTTDPMLKLQHCKAIGSEQLYARFSNCRWDPRAFTCIDARGFPKLESRSNVYSSTGYAIYVGGFAIAGGSPSIVTSVSDQFHGVGKDWRFGATGPGYELKAHIEGEYSDRDPAKIMIDTKAFSACDVQFQRRFIGAAVPRGGLAGDRYCVSASAAAKKQCYVASFNSESDAGWKIDTSK